MNYRKAHNTDLDKLVLFNNYRIFYYKDLDIAEAKVFLSERITNCDSEIFVAEDTDGKLLGFV